MASAGYWIGSAAKTVVSSVTGGSGSIGVVAAYQDTRESDQRKGIKTHEIISSVSPNKRPDPATDAGRAQIQAIVDSMGNVFVNSVARNRGVDFESVLKNYGQGQMFIGQDAVDHGLDRLFGLNFRSTDFSVNPVNQCCFIHIIELLVLFSIAIKKRKQID